MKWLLAAFGILAAGCVSDEAIRGKDRSALLPSGRVLYLRKPSEPLERTRFASGVEGSVSTLRGVLTHPNGSVDYAADVGAVHAVFGATAPRFEVLGLVGGAYGDLDIDTPSQHTSASSLGVSAGVAVAYRPVPWAGPYGRYVRHHGDDWYLGRIELGLEFRIDEWLGLQVAWAEQVMEDEFDPFSDFRIETSGVHLGVGLRF